VTVHSFPAVATREAWVLVLGTMPGKVSLREQQYYAHPRNLFWRLSGELLVFDAAGPYEIRVGALMSHGVALWDVLQSCARDSSLDSDIDESTVVTNDIVGFLASHPLVRRVCFNGVKAASLFAKHVRPHLGQELSIQYLPLPSTSPANASIRWEEKLRAWGAIKRGA